MSDQLYLYKAQRYLDRSEQQKSVLLASLIDSLSLKIHNGQETQLRDDLTKLLDKWQDRFIPRFYECDNGDRALAVPYCTVHRDYASKHMEMNCRSYTRLFHADAQRKITIGNLEFKNTDQLTTRKRLHNILQNGDIKQLGHQLNSGDGYKHLYFDRKEYDHIFMKQRFRYQSIDGMSHALNKQVHHLGHKGYQNNSFELSKAQTANLETIIKLWGKAAETSLLSMADREALHTVLLNTQPNENDYNWLTSSGGSVIRDRRLGAYISQPGLTSQFARHAMNGATGKVTTVCEGIDQGISVPQSFINALFEGESGAIPKRYLSPYHGANDTVFTPEATEIFVTNFNTLPLLNYVEYPRTKRDWEEFETFSRNLFSAQAQSNIPTKTLFAAYAQNIPDRPDNKQSWRDVGDFAKKLYNSMLLPIIAEKVRTATHIKEPMAWTARIAERTAIKKEFLNQLTIQQVIRGSRDWHDRINTVDAQIKSLAIQADISWSELFAPMSMKCGVQIHALTSKAALEKEGEEMHHCVGGYASNCVIENCHILHLTYQGKQSTLQLQEVIGDNYTGVKQIQHQAEWNNQPDPALREAAQALIDGINNKSIEIDWGRIFSERAPIQEEYKKDEIRNRIGFDPLDEGQRDQAYDIMNRFCYGKMSKLSRAEFIEQSGLSALIEKELSIIQNKPANPKLPVLA